MPEKKTRTRPTTPSFTHEFKLKVNDHSARKYNIKFKALQELYNTVLGEIFKRHDAMLDDPTYKEAQKLYKVEKKEAKKNDKNKTKIESDLTSKTLFAALRKKY